MVVIVYGLFGGFGGGCCCLLLVSWWGLLSLLWISLCLFGWGFWLVFWCVCGLVVCLVPSVWLRTLVLIVLVRLFLAFLLLFSLLLGFVWCFAVTFCLL